MSDIKFIKFDKNIFIGNLLLIGLFFITVIIRGKFIGTYSDFPSFIASAGHHQFITAHSHLSIENWLNQGIKNLNFLSVWDPKSIEHANVLEQYVYTSYPAGFLLPVFFIKQIFPNLSTLFLLHLYSLINHLFISITIFWTIRILLNKSLNSKMISYYSTLAGASYLFFPLPFYSHSMVYFADQLIIFPFSIIILFEVLLREKNEFNKALLALIQSIIFLISATIDYLVVPMAIIIFIFRILDRSPIYPKLNLWNFFQNALQLFSPILIAISFHMANIYNFGLWDQFNNIRKLRTSSDFQGADTDLFNLFKWIFLNHAQVFWGSLIIISFLCIVIFYFYTFGKRFFKEDKDLIIIPLIAYLSCFLQIILLRNHSMMHNFSVLKFFYPLSISFFSTIPILINKLLIYKFNIKSQIYPIIFCIFIMFIGFGKITVGSKILNQGAMAQFPEPKLIQQSTLKAIKDNFKYEDVLIGLNDFVVTRHPPQRLVAAGQNVYKFQSWEELKNKIVKQWEGSTRIIPDEANKILILRQTSIYDDQECQDLNKRLVNLGNDGFSFLRVKGNEDLDYISGCVNPD